MTTSMEAMAQDLLSDLNEPQRRAVTHTEGPLLILAGPGSGKTRVVTRRAAYLAATVTRPENILAITFTNKAAREMRERVQALGVSSAMTVGTFHAISARLLRQFHDRAGIPANFTIFDQDDRRKLIRECVELCGLSPENFAPVAVERFISRNKNELRDPTGDFGDDWRDRTYARVYLTYEERLRAQGGLDFDDLLMRMALVLQKDEELRQRLENRFRYVLVDEYQDTNAAQYLIARSLTRQHANLCATGDPDQSIYGWRGANIDNILRFEKDYPRAVVVRLEQNYRSTPRILKLADALIAGNTQRKQKGLWTQNDDGPAVRVLEFDDAEQEARGVARDIRELIREGAEAREIAILYRINALSRLLEERLIDEGIPYQVARGVAFYNRKEIKDVLAYLRVLINPDDETAFLRIINTPPRGIGGVTVERLVSLARQRGVKLGDAIRDEAILRELGRASGKVAAFATLLQQLSVAPNQPPAQALPWVISHSGLRAHYAGEHSADSEPAANLDELVNAAVSFAEENPEATLLDWLEHAALVSDVDSLESEGGKVTLMTLHAAKGLEFDTVYLVGLENGLLPFQRRGDDGVDDLEEERRLLFVGITRARKRLTLTRALYRMVHGGGQRTTRSLFLDELPRSGLEWPESEVRSSSVTGRDRARLSEDELRRCSVGTVVRHRAYGLGQIIRLERGPSRTHGEIVFQNGKCQVMVLEFAELAWVDPSELD